MKKKELKEVHSKTLKELRVLEKKTREELARLKVDLRAGKLKNIQQFISKRSNFAKIKTIIRERQFEDETA